MLLLKSIGLCVGDIIMIFCTSEIGHRTTEAFSEVNNALDELDWYLYPTKIQRMLPTIMACAQKPVEINFFGSIASSREQFTKVSFNC